MKKIFFIYILFHFILNKQYSSINDLPNQKTGFYEFNLNIPSNCKPLYFTDINNDKRMDIIVSCMTDKDSTITYFIYNSEKKIFSQNSTNNLILKNKEVLSFIANDLNRDSYIDYVITYKDLTSNLIHSSIYIFNPIQNYFEEKYIIKNSDKNLFIANIGSDSGLKIIFYQDDKRKVLKFTELDIIIEDFSNYISSNINVCDGNNKYNNFPFTSPNSNSFVDMNGDCLNDLVISSYNPKTNKKYLEIWQGVFEDDKIKYCLSSHNIYELDDRLGLFTISDIDRNAMLDIVFPILNTNKILIAFNTLSMSYTWTEDYCDNHEPLTLTSSSKNSIQKIFDDFIIDLNNNDIFTVKLLNDDNYIFYNNEEEFPLYLRFLDINQDSYPDFLTIFYNKNTHQTNPIIFLSQKILYDVSFKGTQRRSFSKDFVYTFEGYSNIKVATFFDFEDNGKMDLIFYDMKGLIRGIYNKNVYDSYTMKSILLFESNCFFCNEFGSTQRFITTNIDGTRRMDLSIQNVQNSLMGCLSLNYAYLGIGRSNNYIENFQIISGTFKKDSDNYKTYTPVIPNSQLIIYHTKDKDKKTIKWKVDLVVEPTQKLPLLIASIIVMVSVMVLFATYLQMKERREDNIENKETFAPWFG